MPRRAGIPSPVSSIRRWPGSTFEKLPAEFVPALGLLNADATATSPDGKLIAQSQCSRMPAPGRASRSKEYSLSSVVVRETASGRDRSHPDRALGRRRLPGVQPGRPPARDGELRSDHEALGHADRPGRLHPPRTHRGSGLAWPSVPMGIGSSAGGIDATARVWNATPLASNMTAEHDARYRKKIETLRAVESHDRRRRACRDPGRQRPMGHGGRGLRQGRGKGAGELQFRYKLHRCAREVGRQSRAGAACDDISSGSGKQTPLTRPGSKLR